MPNMNGYELQKHINEAFRLPVICEFLFPVNIYLHYMTTVNLIDTTTNVHWTWAVISADNRAELEGIQNGAVYVMIKPISIDDLKYIWQFSVWWQKKINGTTPSFREINNQSEVYVNTVPSNGIFSGKKSLFIIDYNNITFNMNFNKIRWLLILTQKKLEKLCGQAASILDSWKRFSSLVITVSPIYHMPVTIAISSYMHIWHFKNTFMQELYQKTLCKSWTCLGLLGNKSPAICRFLNSD